MLEEYASALEARISKLENTDSSPPVELFYPYQQAGPSSNIPTAPASYRYDLPLGKMPMTDDYIQVLTVLQTLIKDRLQFQSITQQRP
jgi:hypothetical protein